MTDFVWFQKHHGSLRSVAVGTVCCTSETKVLGCAWRRTWVGLPEFIISDCFRKQWWSKIILFLHNGKKPIPKIKLMAWKLRLAAQMHRQTLAVDTTVLPQACLFENFLAMKALNTDVGVVLPFVWLRHDDGVMHHFWQDERNDVSACDQQMQVPDRQKRDGARGITKNARGCEHGLEKARACAMSNIEFNLAIQFSWNFWLARASNWLARASNLLAQMIIGLVIFLFLARTLAFFFSDVPV